MKKLVGIVLSVAMLTTALAGCGGGTETGKINSDMPTGEITYPIDTQEKLSYWVRLSGNVSTSIQNYAESEFAKAYMEKTGINVEYQHPAAGEEKQSLNLLIASGELPDIIETTWLDENPAMQIEDEVIIALNDCIDNYSPYLKKYLSENPEIDKQIKTDSGQYYVYPFIRGDEKLRATSGFIIRRDWLKELGLEMPETIEDWEKVITAFKSKGEMPLGLSMGGLTQFLGGYGIGANMYVNDGKVQYGQIKEEYKQFLTDMKRWYDNGLIDKNAAVLDGKLINTNVLNHKTGVLFGAGGGSLGVLLNAKKGSGEQFDLGPAPFPTTEKGVKPEFGNKQLEYSPINGAAITAQAKNPALAARFLDYSYGEEGYMLNNFGIEGVSYEMVDGYPKYTDVITNNPDGLAIGQAMPLYFRASTEGPLVQDVRYIEQYYAEPAQKEALEVWSNCNHDAHIMPQVTLTEDEANEYSKLMTAIGTYVSEMMVKFIVGEEPIENFDKYIETLKGMNVDRAIEIQQAALDRFNAR